jgi:hypothetical protein
LPSHAIASVSTGDGGREVFVSFPDFLRRGGETWRTGSVISGLSERFGSSRASIREDLWPTLLATHNSSLGGSETDFRVAKKMGLSVEDHLAMHGIPKSSKSAKEIMKNFGEEELGRSAQILVTEATDNQVVDDDQPTLDRFG